MRGANSKLYVVLALAISLLVAGSSVHAQGNQGKQQGQGQGQYQKQQRQQNQPQAKDFSSSEIESFVSARGEIDELRQKFRPKFQKADDVDQAQELRKEFQKEAVQILDEEGLDVQTYNGIVKGMDRNKELRNKIQKKMGQ
jgi:hypothetical protein